MMRTMPTKQYYRIPWYTYPELVGLIGTPAAYRLIKKCTAVPDTRYIQNVAAVSRLPF